MLNDKRIQFQKEQDQLLQTILDLRFFLPWKDTQVDDGSLRSDANLEIYITNQCNKKCKYCYLWKYPGLYPQDKLDHNLILNNLEILYKWILKEGFYIPKVDLFTGEIWHEQFGLDVLELTLKYIKQGIQVNWWMIPSNCSFIHDDVQLAKIQSYIDRFREYGQQLSFSISVDGAPIESDTRPNNDKSIQADEIYWEKLFTFAKHNDYYFHPMISARSIDKWIDNFKWWEESFKKYDLYSINRLMMLEVRNDDWTDEKIQLYCNFLEFLIDKYYTEVCHKDIQLFTNHLFSLRGYESDLTGYIPFCFAECDTFIGCTQATDLTVRLGDLAICPCHRLAYDKYLYGHFKVENDEIIGVTANNPQAAIKILMANFNLCSFGCDTCIYNKYCLKGCHGMQYESMGDPFIPNPNICNFFKKKYSFLIEKYKKMGVINQLKTISKYEKDYESVHSFLNLVAQYENEEVK